MRWKHVPSNTTQVGSHAQQKHVMSYQYTLITQPIVHPVNPPCQPTLTSHPFNYLAKSTLILFVQILEQSAMRALDNEFETLRLAMRIKLTSEK